MVAGAVSTGRFTSGVVDASVTPRIIHPGRVVVYLHGAGATATEALGAVVTNIRPILRSCVDAGLVVVAPTVTQLWGNATCKARIDDAVAFARTNYGCTAEPPVLIGASHGAACAFRYAKEADVSAVVGIIPAIDLAWIRDNDPEGIDLTSSIETALGLAGGAQIPAAADPAQFAADLVDVPIQLWVATDDDVSHGYEAFSTTTGADLHTMGALGHTDAAVGAVDRAEMLDFIAAAP